MPKKTLIITAIIVALIAIGVTATYITLRQASEEVRQEQPVVTLPGAPEEPVIQPEQPITTEPIDTSDWKTYRNEKYAYELKIKNSWKPVDILAINEMFPSYIKSAIGFGDPKGGDFYIRISVEKRPVSNIVRELKHDPYGQIVDEQVITVNGNVFKCLSRTNIRARSLGYNPEPSLYCVLESPEFTYVISGGQDQVINLIEYFELID